MPPIGRRGNPSPSFNFGCANFAWTPVRRVHCRSPRAARHYCDREIAYGGRDRVHYFFHIVQEFLFLLLAFDKRGNFMFCDWL